MDQSFAPSDVRLRRIAASSFAHRFERKILGRVRIACCTSSEKPVNVRKRSPMASDQLLPICKLENFLCQLRQHIHFLSRNAVIRTLSTRFGIWFLSQENIPVYLSSVASPGIEPSDRPYESQFDCQSACSEPRRNRTSNALGHLFYRQVELPIVQSTRTWRNPHSASGIGPRNRIGSSFTVVPFCVSRQRWLTGSLSSLQ